MLDAPGQALQLSERMPPAADTVEARSRLCAIAVMAKAPRAGKVKTRLSPPLEPEEARLLSAAFLRDITENLRLAAQEASIQGFVAYAPAGLEPLFDGLLAPGTRLVLADGTIPPEPGVEGFGLCLLHAVQSLLAQGYGAACVLNSDSPTLPTGVLRDLAHLLVADGARDGAQERAVLGPADDGGYYVLGMRRSHAGLFRDIAWSTDRVADQTRARAAELGLELVELPAWFDVDDRAALQRLVDDRPDPACPHLPYLAPATRALLDGMGIAARLRDEAND